MNGNEISGDGTGEPGTNWCSDKNNENEEREK